MVIHLHHLYFTSLKQPLTPSVKSISLTERLVSFIVKMTKNTYYNYVKEIRSLGLTPLKFKDWLLLRS